LCVDPAKVLVPVTGSIVLDAMAVGTEYFEVLNTPVAPVPILVVEMQHRRFLSPPAALTIRERDFHLGLVPALGFGVTRSARNDPELKLGNTVLGNRRAMP
jgi:hypothetical protein